MPLASARLGTSDTIKNSPKNTANTFMVATLLRATRKPSFINCCADKRARVLSHVREARARTGSSFTGYFEHLDARRKLWIGLGTTHAQGPPISVTDWG